MAKSDLLLMAEVVSQEKNLDKDVVVQAIEAALATATRKKVGIDEMDVEVVIDRATGDFKTYRVWHVVDDDAEIEFPDREITVTEAKNRNGATDVEVGAQLRDQLENAEFGRISVQAAKQVINQKVREAERSRIASEYGDRVGSMVSGVVKRMDRGDFIIDLGGVEAILPRNRTIGREMLRNGDRIRAILAEIDPTVRGPILILDRLDPRLVAELFKVEVPEISEGLIDVMAAARDPGSRAKIAVRANDSRIDPVGACVGVRGSRVQSVINELNSERIDIIIYSDDPAEFVINALQPAEISSIMIDEEAGSMDLVVDEDNLSQAIGRQGQNVRLASQLTGWQLDILSDEEATTKANEELEAIRDRLMVGLSLDAELASILAENGYRTIEEIAYVPKQELVDIEDLDEEIVDALRSRAQDALITQAIASAEEVSLAEPAEDMFDVEGMNEEVAKLLASKGIATRDDLAELATDELIEILPEMSEEEAGDLIVKARAHWFE